MKKTTKKKKNQSEDIWVDIHNDDVMRSMGFMRPLPQAPRDESVWTKTPTERRILKTLKHSYKKDMHFHTPPRKFIKVPGKLVVYLKKNKKFSKPVYSYDCWQSDIPSILSKFYGIISKYSWNGRTCKELPI